MRGKQSSIFVAVAFLSTFGVLPARAECNAPPTWLPATPDPDFGRPPSHAQGGSDCVFYSPSYQLFLRVMQPSGDGRPAFLSYPTIADVFGPILSPKVAFRAAARENRMLSLSPRAFKGSNDPESDDPGRPGPSSPGAINAGVRQAGLDGLLIDRNGRPIFYAIHMNPAFEAFVREKGLTTKAGLQQSAERGLEFPKGVVELKSAWQVLEGGPIPDSFVTTRALVPRLKVDAGRIVIDETAPPREVDVALLAIHVAFVLEGHPEFVWSTFEHVDGNGEGDLAPLASGPPSDTNGLPDGVDGPVSARDFVLFKAGTAASAANQAVEEAAMAAAFDRVSQRFVGAAPLQTSIYRYFPTSKTTAAKGDPEDGDITDLNRSVRALFESAAPGDKRKHYRLVGAIWLDKPETFTVGKPIRNPPGISTDDDLAPVAGEDGLSSLAMESFTQNDFPNCFSCHDARIVKNGSTVLMLPNKLNVSHILSKFIADLK